MSAVQQVPVGSLWYGTELTSVAKQWAFFLTVYLACPNWKTWQHWTALTTEVNVFALLPSISWSLHKNAATPTTSCDWLLHFSVFSMERSMSFGSWTMTYIKYSGRVAGSHARTTRVLMFMVVPGHIIFIYTISCMKAGHTSLTPLFVMVYIIAALVQVLYHLGYVLRVL